MAVGVPQQRTRVGILDRARIARGELAADRLHGGGRSVRTGGVGLQRGVHLDEAVAEHGRAASGLPHCAAEFLEPGEVDLGRALDAGDGVLQPVAELFEAADERGGAVGVLDDAGEVLVGPHGELVDALGQQHRALRELVDASGQLAHSARDLVGTIGELERATG